MTHTREDRAFTSTIALATILTEAASIAQTVFEGQRDATVPIVLVPCLLAATSLAAFYAVDAEKLAIARVLTAVDVALCLGMVVLSRTYGFLAPFPVIAVVCVCERDKVTPARTTEKLASRAARGEVKRYDVGHFDIYVGSWFDRLSDDQLAFLERHVPVGAAATRALQGAVTS